MYGVAQSPPLIQWAFHSVLFDRFDRAIDRHPCHHLGMSKMPARSTHLPDAFVGFEPMLLDEVHQYENHIPYVLAGFDSIAARDVKGVHDFAIDVELELIMRGIADAHRAAVLVARQPRRLELGQATLTCYAIHDLDLRRFPGDRAQ